MATSLDLDGCFSRISQKVTNIIYDSFNLIVINEEEGGFFAIILKPNALYPLNVLPYGSLDVLLNFGRRVIIITADQ